MRIVIIGNGMVGYKFCEKLLASPKASQFELTVFGEETRPAYDRVHLSEFFSGKSVEDLTLASAQWYTDNGIRLYLADPVVHIDRTAKTIRSHQGLSVPYDYLVMATGSAAFVPAIPGVEKDGVFIYRTIEDLKAMCNWAPKAKKAAVIGGGLLGLEAAKALIDLGITNTHIIEFAPRLMPRQIDAPGSAILEARLSALGLAIHTQKNTSSIDGETTITGLSFTDGEKLAVDMLVISAGIKLRDELARAAGLQVGARGGSGRCRAGRDGGPGRQRRFRVRRGACVVQVFGSIRTATGEHQHGRCQNRDTYGRALPPHHRYSRH